METPKKDEMSTERVSLDSYFNLSFGEALSVAPHSETTADPDFTIQKVDDSWKKVTSLERMSHDEYVLFCQDFIVTEGRSAIYDRIRKARMNWSSNRARESKRPR